MTAFQYFSAMYITSFVLEATEKWEDPYFALVWLALFPFLVFPRVKPSRFALFLVFSTLYLLRRQFPDVPNHVNLFLSVNAIGLAVISYHFLRRGILVSPARFITDLRPVVILVVVIVYFFAGFHKLNADFFHYEAGCARHFIDHKFIPYYRLPAVDPPRFAVLASGLLVIAWELGGSLALLFRRTQPFMLLFSFAMHLLLAVCKFFDFTSLIFSLFLLLLPVSYWKILEEDETVTLFHRRIKRLHIYQVNAIVMGSAIGLLADSVSGTSLYRTVGVLYVVSTLVLAWPLIKAIAGRRTPPWIKHSLRVSPRFLYLFPAFLVFYGMNNYLGLRTAGTFSMFSNIRTEGETSNHFLLGKNPMKIWNFQDDMVHIIEIGRYGRERGSLENYGLPLIEFQKKILEWKRAGQPVPITFRYQKQVFTYDDVTRQEAWVLPKRELIHFLMDFRKIQMEGGPNACRW